MENEIMKKMNVILMHKLNIIFTISCLAMIICLFSCSEVSSPYKPDTINDEDSSNIDIEGVKSDPFISDTNVTEVNDTVVINIVLKIVVGDIVVKEKEHYRGRQVWKVKVKTKHNGSVVIKIDIKSGKVIYIEGGDGAIDYNIIPLDKFIDLQKALKIATDSIQGVVTEWELKWDSKHSWKFEVTIMTDSAVYKIQIKAEGGIIIKVTMKVEDDDDDDGDDDSTGTGDDDSTGTNDTTGSDTTGIIRFDRQIK